MPLGVDETVPFIVAAMPPLVMVTPPTTTLPLPATVLKVPTCVLLVGGLAFRFNVVGDLKIVTVSPPEKVAVNVPVALAATDGPL